MQDFPNEFREVYGDEAAEMWNVGARLRRFIAEDPPPPYTQLYLRCLGSYQALSERKNLQSDVMEALTGLLERLKYNEKLAAGAEELPAYMRVPLIIGLAGIEAVTSIMNEEGVAGTDEESTATYLRQQMLSAYFLVHAAEWERILDYGPIAGVEAAAVQWINHHDV